MCGIAGIFNFENNLSNQLKHIYAMTNAMRHRGPDDEGYIAVRNGVVHQFIGPETPNEVGHYTKSKDIRTASNFHSQVAMGHRRLSILDVSPSGHQPMPDQSGRYWIVFNGEIYNFKEIKKQLKLRGYYFKTHSDTEVILAAYIEWQEECLQYFNGDFSFVIWDQNEKYMFCARDRIGIKPLYYIKNNKHFIFASDIKTLIASG